MGLMRDVLNYILATMILVIAGYLFFAFLAWDLMWGIENSVALRILSAISALFILGVNMQTQEQKQ